MKLINSDEFTIEQYRKSERLEQSVKSEQKRVRFEKPRLGDALR